MIENANVKLSKPASVGLLFTYYTQGGWGGVTPIHRLRHMPLVRVWFLTFPVPKVAQNSFQDFQDVDFDGS